ncbi:hypothetical protein [Catellatospora methionotrophica]|uniref:hypothetical protein n=1 Tax=Catellatospora methionotrophica TaxID=121620 RepID=UPI00140A8D63|nr:hypothetical protein [Catellatospora methionotrophica]
MLAPLLGALLVLTGCQAITDDGVAPDRARLLADMAAQLQRASQRPYHAQYLLADGVRGEISQQAAPARSVYSYPGGRLMVDAEGQTSCVTAVRPARCQIRPLPGPGPAALTGYHEVTRHGLVTAPIVTDLLQAAQLQSQAEVEAHDVTLAGQQATCLDVSGLTDAEAGGFTVCVTAAGVLASFTGVVGGVVVDQALTRISASPPAAVFALPEGARVVDHRPKTPAP